MGFVPLLLPFVWVLELDSCGHAPVETPLTGFELTSKLGLDTWAVIVPVLLITVLTPFIARLFVRPLFRFLTHVVGLLATGFSGYAAFIVLLFTIFTDRMPRGFGWVIIALFVLSFLDAVLRVVWSVQEWVAARRQAPVTTG